ncbi:thyroid adenoma-associated protein homolog [Ceratina calcarata]|uniref:tRNA (32-2'-O)-methyltransferase regulator THADA n=1 Tax=Ceratina calcarata TaxID=156304 RepID=A0AAJ7N957_9HYME|nr:thyroid adenoma-associated protein homolog [Ceratina calcarata]
MFKDTEIKRQLRELLRLKRSGELDTEEKILNSNNEYWRDSVLYADLERYVYHQDEEIKLNTLALIVESKKSTLRFTSRELDIIILFLNVNFKEKIEFVPLIQKVLKRMKDGLTVMRRQSVQNVKTSYLIKKEISNASLHMKQTILDQYCSVASDLQKAINMYCTVFQTLHDMCICSPDATYTRRKSSLQILLSMKDILGNEYKQVTWETRQSEAVFNLMLLDTYEENKEMALKIMKSMDPCLLQLDDESYVRDIILVAMELGNSIRPIDTITSAYMLKLSMLSPILLNVLESSFSLTKQSENNTEAIVLQLLLLLLKELKQSSALAKENIVKTVTQHSLYGYLFCIRSLLEECNLKSIEENHVWQNTIGELVSLCFELSHAVSLIVNNSSPEGHLPTDLNLRTIDETNHSTSDEQIVTPQMVLLCSWRTIKEVSLLFGLLAIKAPMFEDNSSIGLLNDGQIVQIGEHLVSLLSETKHRGAFEQAYVGFSQLCSHLWHLNKENLNRLPKMWLHQILFAIIGFKSNLKFCATRRSAGLPFIIQAILSTEPRKYKDTKTITFDSVMKILLGFTQLNDDENVLEKVQQLIYSNSAFAQYENLINSTNENNFQITEIKTHALNILRAIFRHSHLAEVVNNYVEDGLIAAFRSYDAPSWAERNAATLLFSALIIRIFGVQRTKDHINLTIDNKMNFESFFQKYPSLLPYILEELKTVITTDRTIIKSSVQAILLLLSRLYHNRNSESYDSLSELNNLIGQIIQCAKSAILETRKLAARALVPLLTKQSVGPVLSTIIENIASLENNQAFLNLIHGYMLQIYEGLKHFNLKLIDIDWNRFFKSTTWILENLEGSNSKHPCFLLAAVYTDICNEICKVDETYLAHFPILDTLISHLLHDKLKQGPARELYKLSAIKFIRSIAWETSLIQQYTPVRIYLHNLRVPETQIVAWSTLAEIISKLKYHDVSVLLITYAANEVRNFKQYFRKYSPELQDAIFDFLYDSLMYLNRIQSPSFTERKNICKLVLNEIRQYDNENGYSERDSYLRLLGKSYVTLASFDKDDETITLECTNYVYTNLCDNLWIASSNMDVQRSVFEIMHELFIVCYEREEYRYVQIQWWTTLLQLLLDNNSKVRHEAFLLLDRVPVHPKIVNSPLKSNIDLLLSKFHECNIHNKDPEFICIVLFYWSIALINDADYEMDDTDVFNKCTNLDFLEPIKVSEMCAKFLMENMKYCFDTLLPNAIIDWISSRLNVEFQRSISFRTFVMEYKSFIPDIQNKLDNFLNPTYKNKLLQLLAYEQYKTIYL